MAASPSIPSYVFPPEWIAKKKQRFAHRPAYHRPNHYNLWTSDDCKDSRDEIEIWVDRLTLEAREKIIPRLRAPENLEQTYNELLVADSLQRLGHAVEYEVELRGLTPDWSVLPVVGGSKFILEVVSSKPPQDRNNRDAAWKRFRQRLAAIPESAILSVQPPFDTDMEQTISPPSETRQKQIVQNVHRWLQESARSEGDRCVVDGIQIEFAGRFPNLDHVCCGISCTPFCIDSAPLRKSLKDKAGKYREVIQRAHFPFVVCVVPDFGSGYGLDDMEEAVLGTLHYRIVTREGRPLPFPFRDSDGLFRKYPTLSAVTLGKRQGASLTHTVLRNPSAICPLPEGLFPVEKR
jgi:hypothetical protein